MSSRYLRNEHAPKLRIRGWGSKFQRGRAGLADVAASLQGNILFTLSLDLCLALKAVSTAIVSRTIHIIPTTTTAAAAVATENGPLCGNKELT